MYLPWPSSLTMMRNLLQHATYYGIRSVRRMSLHTVANKTLQCHIAEALDQNAKIIPVLQRWRQQGNQVNPSQVRDIIRYLRDSGESLQALQVSEWMSEETICNLIPEDFASRLHLIDKVVWLEEAEKFFQNIPKSARDGSVYTSLLTSYTRSDKTLCKAEATFQKMRELGLLSRLSPYNAILSVYAARRDREKVEEMLREMKANDVEADSGTVNQVLKLYSALPDVVSMEKFLSEWEAVLGIKLEWLTTLDMAKAYLREGSKEKAIKMMALTEKVVDTKSLKPAYELLMKLYSEVGDKEEFLRIWNLYKKCTKHCDNNGYLTAIRSLLKLDDIVWAEEIYKVWESLPLEFDIRIPSMLASGYRERGMIDKAEKLMNDRTIRDKRMKKPITPILEQWGNKMKQSDLKCLIKTLRDSNQFSKALQVSEWMGEKRVCNLYSEDYASRLYLIENVLGLEEAEKFFETIPENMKDYSVYATLLSSYAKSDKNFGKAGATFQKMRELGFLLKPSPFNSMLSFYNTKYTVEEILREMKENNVDPDGLMVNKILMVYAAKSKVEEMDEFMRLWGGEDGIKLERSTMVAMAKAYAKSGLTKQAIEIYGDVSGSQREVYRLWNEFKKSKAVEDEGLFMSLFELDDKDCKKKEKLKEDVCRTVIRSSLKLDDVEGAEYAYREWKPNGPKLDLRIPGLLISRFFAEGKELKIKELVKSIRGKRNEMHLRMLKAFGLKVGRCVVTILVFVVGLPLYSFIAFPWFYFFLWI